MRLKSLPAVFVVHGGSLVSRSPVLLIQLHPIEERIRSESGLKGCQDKEER
jgi:hypothetical protein